MHSLEGSCIEVHKPNSSPYVIATVHRPPNATVEIFDKIEHLIKLVDNENKELYILMATQCLIIFKKVEYLSYFVFLSLDPLYNKSFTNLMIQQFSDQSHSHLEKEKVITSFAATWSYSFLSSVCKTINCYKIFLFMQF